ncbi:hypothetical protein D0C36_12240 [Mucilaginibacter conchicola]|uniref:Uncharacterized protein n=1 Tax=Mucilaginibacter conchicola TaxID=2303333 RepID=A0A372NSV0_9SPHI|nr:hypothetical protein [Mucilaginibacter conchicola]RFZ92202.1 hypothetical protein D0C36_12240 [Mucilaginibacter conchicola]
MKVKNLVASLLVVILATSCSKQVYNNNAYLAKHKLEGKTLAILPVEVHIAGRTDKNNNRYAEEQALSLNLQNQFHQDYLRHAGSPGKGQQHVMLLDPEMVNSRLQNKVADLRSVWALPADSVGRMAGADLVYKIRISTQRYMSKDLAKGINTGLFLLESIIENKKSSDIIDMPNVKAEDVDYDISLIETRTGEVISKYINNPDREKDEPIKDINKKMVKAAAVYVGR